MSILLITLLRNGHLIRSQVLHQVQLKLQRFRQLFHQNLPLLQILVFPHLILILQLLAVKLILILMTLHRHILMNLHRHILILQLINLHRHILMNLHLHILMNLHLHILMNLHRHILMNLHRTLVNLHHPLMIIHILMNLHYQALMYLHYLLINLHRRILMNLLKVVKQMIKAGKNGLHGQKCQIMEILMMNSQKI